MKKQKVSGLLDDLYLAAPCSLSWESMQGDDRQRLCKGCSRQVYNISAMTKSEAESFLAENGTNQCMIFYRRSDGTIMTDDCPVGLRKLRDRARALKRLAAGAIAFILSVPAVLGQTTKLNDERTDLSSSRQIGADGTRLIDGGSRKLLGKVAAPSSTVRPNPAGGVIIRTENPPTPEEDLPHVNTVNQVNITSPNPDTRIIVHPITRPNRIPNPTSTHEIRRSNKNLDAEASTFFQKGNASEKQMNYELAEFYYEKALNCYDKQKSGDAKFRQLIERHLKAVESKLKK